MRVVHEARTPDERARLHAAAEAAARARPPGIVRVVAIDGTGDGARTVTTDEPAGPTIAEHPVERAAFTPLARALAALHGAGVAHGAVRPDTIRVDAVGRAVLPLPRWTGAPATADDDVHALARLVGEAGARSASEIADRLGGSAGRPALFAPRRRPSRTPTTAVGGVIAAVGALVLVAVLLLPAGTASAPPATTRARRTAPTLASLATPPVVDLAGRRYAVGAPGDTIVVGRWGCAPEPTPAVVRPATGEVFVFAIAADGATATPVTRVANPTRARRATDPDGCDALVVDTATGATTVTVRTAGRSPSPATGAARPPRSPAAAPPP